MKTLPTHRGNYDIARMEAYELYLKMHKANPDCESIGVKTYCLVLITSQTNHSHVFNGAVLKHVISQ